MKITQNLKRAFYTLFEHIAEITALSCIGYFYWSTQFSNELTEKQLLVYILAILGLIAFSMILQRMTVLRRVENLIKQINFPILHKDYNSFDKFFYRRSLQPSFEQRLDKAREIIITGGSLTRITGEYLGYFEKKAESKCKIKFLLVKPDCDASRLLVSTVVYEIEDIDTYIHQTETSIQNLLKIKKMFPKNIEVKMTTQLPPFGLVISDPNRKSGSMTIEIYGHSLPARDRGSFFLKKAKEPEAFNYFMDQFDRFWREANSL